MGAHSCKGGQTHNVLVLLWPHFVAGQLFIYFRCVSEILIEAA